MTKTPRSSRASSPTSRHVNTKQWRKLREDVLAESDICGFCGLPGATELDHIIPAALGGEMTRENTRPSHASCNRAAGARLGNKLRGQRRRRPRKEQNMQPTPNPAPEVFRAAGTPASPSAPERSSRGRKSSRKPDSPRIHADGFVLPRLESSGVGVAGSWGVEAADWIDGCGVLGPGNRLRPWQRYVLGRALETREDGRLRWPTVVLTVSRQQGKSVLLKGLAYWRLHQAERFGQPQTILHVANRALTAREAWEPAARLAEETYGVSPQSRAERRAKLARIVFSLGRESLQIPDGSRWLVQAATPSAGVGYSISLALLDEAWAIPRSVAESAISPTMAAMEQPQMWLISTSGDSSSDLLQSYRAQALADPDGSVLLLEWSTPPEMDYADPQGWRWASPEWDERREEFLRGRVAAMPSGEFRAQYLNQWQVAVDGWMPAADWAACGVQRLAAPRRKDHVTVALETSQLDQRVTVVAAWRRDNGKVALWSYYAHNVEDAWRWIGGLNPVSVLLPPDLAVHSPGDPRVVTQVGSRELRSYLPGVQRAILARQVQYKRSDEFLTGHVLAAVAHGSGDTGRVLSSKHSPGPIQAARCMVWAVGDVLRPRAPKPQIVVE